jgi:4-amino-4-deoxy-L-arabinose transferase-like glycosyltransferase
MPKQKTQPSKADQNPTGEKTVSRRLSILWVPLIASVVIVVFVHLYMLDAIPRGLWIDESAIGHNAISIAMTGKDEHGASYPIFPRMLNDYRGGLFIYSYAAFHKVFGSSTFLLRAHAALHFGVFLAALLAMLSAYWRQSEKRSLLPYIYSVLAIGFLPWLFTFSRISFEVNSQLSTLALALLCTYLTYHGKRMHLLFGILAGAFIGLNMYSYATARLLAPFLFCTVLLLYARPRFALRTALLIVTFAIVVLPFVSFAVHNPELQSQRFNEISYLKDNNKTFVQKAAIFSDNYFKHWSPNFLVLNGDENDRHATGFGGEVYWTVLGLFLIGAIVAVMKLHRFGLLLVMNCIAGPAAASLTVDGVPHALRSVSLGVFIVIISCIGFEWITQQKHRRMLRILPLVLLCVLVVESGAYVHNYFTGYRDRSALYFGGGIGLEDALRNAITKRPTKVLMTDHQFKWGFGNWEHRGFYQKMFAYAGIPYSFHFDVQTLPQYTLQNTCLINGSNPEELAFMERMLQGGVLPITYANTFEGGRHLHCFGSGLLLGAPSTPQ